MKELLRLVLMSAALLVVSLAFAPAQQTLPPNMRRLPPRENVAYNQAMAIKDPQKRLAALENILRDYPNSEATERLHVAIFTILVKLPPLQEEKLVEHGRAAVQQAPAGRAKVAIYTYLSGLLCDAGILLDQAEKWASAGLAIMEGEPSMGRRSNNLTPPPRGAITRETNTWEVYMSGILTALGRAYLKQGKLDEAEAKLQEALFLNPQLPISSIGMAELQEKRGNIEQAIAAYVDVAATGKIPASARERLEALYAKSHNGSLAGLDEVVDERYMDLNPPPPFVVQPYDSSLKRTDRRVIAEIFTSASSVPCVAADLAADLAMQRYGRDNLAVLMYHQNIPLPDPMATSQTVQRAGYYGMRLLPAIAIDGQVLIAGGGGREAAAMVYNRMYPYIEKGLKTSSKAQLRVSAQLIGNIIKTNLLVNQIASKSEDLKLHVVLAERRLRYCGENGIRFHPMVVRAIATTSAGQGIPIRATDVYTLGYDFDLKAISAWIKKYLDGFEMTKICSFSEKEDGLNPQDLVIVAFLQEEERKTILQSTMVRISVTEQDGYPGSRVFPKNNDH